ncbi:MAG: NAD-dependent deacylase [Candidatus Marinimicrobia bacterium]|jgi:NAD-dependent deacetylase|nr:NAD-dependent deacylase [Candidatus Neomarinimicrobiota bacterium]MDP6611557.1 NAD-dependent deacylase [Candidatus Neomarinimicrobiota bacterium]|tara:strand:- start:1305 stop:1997 length:693 start_codon:yes stop_codon:yes gene_type:complete
MKKIVVLSGAGMSAESGLKTFRDSDGLWENHNVYDVATPEAWARNPELVLNFYNDRRKQVRNAKPNEAHQALALLESKYDVSIITQNIDDLHERAGSTKVIHLHGEVNKARSSVDPSLIYELNHWEIKLGDTCEKGSQLRPHIVWFGEAVPMIEKAIPMVEMADIIIVIGTSLVVYPAAGLVNYAPAFSEKYYIDPKGLGGKNVYGFKVKKKTAGVGVPELIMQLMGKGG